jgi:hypothetical protein
MNKLEKVLVATAVVGIVGFSYALFTLKDFLDTFNWEEDDE